MLGLVILVDSTRPETFRETDRIIDFFVSYRETPMWSRRTSKISPMLVAGRAAPSPAAAAACQSLALRRLRAR